MESNDQENKEKTETLFEHHRIVVDPGQTPFRIDKFLQTKLLKVSRNRIQTAVKDGAVLVNDKPVKANYKVNPRDVITINFPEEPREPHVVIGEDIPLDIRYEDEDVMVIYKPAGMVVHPGVGNYTGTLVNALKFYLDNLELPVKEGNQASRAGIVHRIDKNTTGLMLVAKTPEAMTHLAKQFFDHTIDRKYETLIWGELDYEEGTIEGHIGRHPSNRLKQTIFEDGEQGKHAITHYKVIERLYYVSLVECVLETGRTHQIRVHMKHMGNPVFNDEKYGGDKVVKGTVFTKYRQFVNNAFKIVPHHVLHAKMIGFEHPRTGERLEFTCPRPDNFEELLVKWRSYLQGRKTLM